MNGADSLCDTLLANDIDVCFANPGTSEMHFVAALDRKPRMRCVLGLFEGVVTGAADGYARMADKPAATLLHLGPGLGNGLANLHNARRARTPMVNVVGDHASYHVQCDAPLTSDGEAVARPCRIGWAASTTRQRSLLAPARPSRWRDRPRAMWPRFFCLPMPHGPISPTVHRRLHRSTSRRLYVRTETLSGLPRPPFVRARRRCSCWAGGLAWPRPGRCGPHRPGHRRASGQ
ncbi:thiamine pyrophosphate enzyme, N-terminal TPP binding domain protein [Bordetella holmesii 44057]|nr:thiamine pyrophosphate enzyme, N-terminal TPP binding domain protein [Bordetella holmesii 44057]